MKRKFNLLNLVVGLTIASIYASQAWATLGGSVDTVQGDMAVMSQDKKLSISKRPNYTIHEMNAKGTAIREYVSTSGVVMAIAWSGPTHPDLELLLGQYLDEYKQSASDGTQHPKVHGRRHHVIKTSNIVVEKAGHIRRLQGRAYIPTLLDSSKVNLNEIK